MEYNSNKDHLLFPEYGRNVQEMIRTIRNEEVYSSERLPGD